MMSSEEMKKVEPDEIAPVKKSPAIVHGDGFVQVIEPVKKVVKGRDKTLYVVYPDGSMRRATPRKSQKGSTKWSKRTSRREMSAAVRQAMHFKKEGPEGQNQES